MPELIGYLFTFNAIFTWAAASLIYKHHLGYTDEKTNLLFRLIIVLISTFFISILLGNYSLIIQLETDQLISYLIASVISGITVTLGDLLYFYSLRKIDASRSYPLTQLSLVIVYPLAFFFFGELITPAILIGGLLILSSVFLLSTKDKPKTSVAKIQDNLKLHNNSGENPEILNNLENKLDETHTEKLILGVAAALGTAFFWALSIISFNQARIIAQDVFVTTFFRILFGLIFVVILGWFDRDYYGSFRKENRNHLKRYLYFGIAGALSLGFADSFFFIAAEINGLVLTSTFTANTPMLQLFLSVIFLKEKFRKRFLIAVILIIIGNYIIIFL